MRAAANGRSMEEEARLILVQGTAQPLGQKAKTPLPKQKTWAQGIADMFQEIGGAEDLVVPERQPYVTSVDFSAPGYGFAEDESKP